jgi:hypothetical protein
MCVTYWGLTCIDAVIESKVVYGAILLAKMPVPQADLWC